MRPLLLASFIALAACNYQPQPSDATKAADAFVKVCDGLKHSGAKLPPAVTEACRIAEDLRPVIADVVHPAGSAGAGGASE
jgi:hypothetical protein